MTVRRWAWGLACAGVLLGGSTLRAGEEARVHEVRAGETLWAIAEATIGDPALWPALYRANRDQIKDPSRLYPGQRLRIPELDAAEQAKVRKEAASLLGK